MIPYTMNNQHWLERSRQAVWHPCTQMKHHETLPLVPIARAQGAWLHDFDGRRYLDGVSSWWVNLFGHANPRINAALKAQLEELEHVMLAGFTHQPVVELSEQLAAIAPRAEGAPRLGHAFYGSDGASATEIALKMSYHYWREAGQAEKTGFLSLQGSYHGETLGALGVTDVPLFKDTYAPLLRNQATVPAPTAGHSLGALAALEKTLAEQHRQLAALFVEPLVQGACGMHMYDPDYLAGARQLCSHYGVHLVADEIMTGFGRTGTLFACEQAGIVPDFLLLSKGITGGYLPMSVVLTTDDVYRAFWHDSFARGFLHSHSYTGNTLACRAALEVLAIFRDDDVINANRERAARWSRLAAPLADHPKVRGFRHRGMIWAFEVAQERPDFARWVYTEALQRGVLLRPIGNSVYFMPPYILTDDEFALLVDCALRVVDAA